MSGGGRVKRTRGVGIDATTSRQTRDGRGGGKSDGDGNGKGAGKQEANGRRGASGQEATGP